MAHMLLSCMTTEKPKKDLLIKNITIVDVESGELIPNKQVIIRGNIIHSIENEINDLSNYSVVQADGKYLIPGLIDSHVHLFVFTLNEWAFPQFVKYGVTGVRDMLTPMDSMSTIQQWRNEFNSGREIPRVLAAGVMVDGGKESPRSQKYIASNSSQGRQLVKKIKENGFDFVKVYSNLDNDTYKAIADEAIQLDLEISGHIPLRVSLIESLEARQITNEHMHQILLACTSKEDSIINSLKVFYSKPYIPEEEIEILDEHILQYAYNYDQTICEEAAKLIAEAGQWQVPTLINERRWYLGLVESQVIDTLLAKIPNYIKESWMKNRKSKDFKYSGDSIYLKKGWNNYKRVVKILADNNVGFLAGTDFRAPWIYPGYSLHQEMELFVEAGFTPLQALQTATINPAKYLNLTDSLGTVEKGKLADLIILNENPLEDISNTQKIFRVILNGNTITPDDLK